MKDVKNLLKEIHIFIREILKDLNKWKHGPQL